MGNGAVSLVKFVDTSNDNATENFGVLFKDGNVLCLCCGGLVEADDCEITENFGGFAYLNETLKEYY